MLQDGITNADFGDVGRLILFRLRSGGVNLDVEADAAVPAGRETGRRSGRESRHSLGGTTLTIPDCMPQLSMAWQKA